jgi:hypothetical protein
MPEQEYPQQRVSKRRDEDNCTKGHCNIHDDTIENIANMAVQQAEQRAEGKTVKWLLGLGLPLLVVLVSAFYASYLRGNESVSKHQDNISTNVEAVKVLVQAGLVASASDRAETKARLDNLENEVGAIKEKLDGRSYILKR